MSFCLRLGLGGIYVYFEQMSVFVSVTGLFLADATCTAWEGNAGWCPNSCLGENTCDYWIAFSDSFTCANLEQKMGCDCSG